MRNLLFHLRALFRRKSMQGALDEEVQSHLRMAARDRVEQGESAEHARASALREFGNVDLVKEVTCDTWGWGWLETMLQDLRYGLRQLRRSPGFAAVAVATLGLGIGATTVVFSVVDAVLLHGTPYRNPSQLVEISAKDLQGEEREVSAETSTIGSHYPKRLRAWPRISDGNFVFSPGLASRTMCGSSRCPAMLFTCSVSTRSWDALLRRMRPKQSF